MYDHTVTYESFFVLLGLQNTHRPLFDEMTQGISEQHKQAIQNIINEGINKQKMYGKCYL